MSFKRICMAVLLLLLLAFSHCQKAASLISGQVHIEYIFSPSMKKSIPLAVALPGGYHKKNAQNRRYPVVLLLHGYSGDYSQFLKLADLAALATNFETILVCPDGGYDSWYVDSPVDSEMHYETHIMKEVLTHIDTTYRTLGRAGRAITGLSMGGFGALRFISLYPDSFVAAGSMSGILDLRVFPNSWNIAGRLGPFSKFPNRWAQNSPVNLVENLKGKNKGILVDCGTEDFALAVNRAYRDSAAVHHVEIQYEEYPGRHSHAYWASRVKPHLQFFQKFMKRRREK